MNLGFVVFAIGMCLITSSGKQNIVSMLNILSTTVSDKSIFCGTLFSTEASKCKLDLGLVVDTTGSIQQQNVPILQAALRHLLQQFDVSASETHVAFMTFAEKSTLHNSFNDASYHNAEAIFRLINESIVLSRPTRLDLALKAAKEEMFPAKNGLRPGVSKAMVLYTDGKTHKTCKKFYQDVVAMKVR